MALADAIKLLMAKVKELRVRSEGNVVLTEIGIRQVKSMDHCK
jgi:hypothetical protein